MEKNNAVPPKARPYNKDDTAGGTGAAESESKRNPAFTEQENEILAQKIEQYYEKLFGKFSDRTSSFEKDAIWQEIADSVSALDVRPRSVSKCKRRYSDLKIKVKAKMAKMNAEYKKTFRLPVTFTTSENIIKQLIPSHLMCGESGLRHTNASSVQKEHSSESRDNSQNTNRILTEDTEEICTVSQESYVSDDNIQEEGICAANDVEPSSIYFQQQDDDTTLPKETEIPNEQKFYNEVTDFCWEQIQHNELVQEKLDTLNNMLRDKNNYMKCISDSLFLIAQLMARDRTSKCPQCCHCDLVGNVLLKPKCQASESVQIHSETGCLSTSSCTTQVTDRMRVTSLKRKNKKDDETQENSQSQKGSKRLWQRKTTSNQ
ncbi:uncharacterized protein LOC128660488 isoform X2 [Bombina bombina]|uniref:uncharacterized protein LOC128660488 isoform X2 n=1 Tax=Bombina bombina TaxID=8345 RepID=UPI00235A82D8|nr:uncharacterized protein LOC128660488 isoform X2 [Bombina bombina]